MTQDRRVGWLAVLAGGVLVLAVQVAAPVGVPLYDGVVVQEPYRYLHPTGDQAGSPTSFSATVQVVGTESPTVVAATTENPPQAQLIGREAAFLLTPSAAQLLVSVTPIEAPPPPAGGSIAGNVYRFSVTDQSGTPLSITECSGCISVVLRAPDGLGVAAIQRYADGAWQTVESVHAGVVAMYQTNATVLGDYAVIAMDEPEAGIDPVVIAGAVIALLLVGAAVFLLFRVKQAPAAPPRSGRGPGGMSGGPSSRPSNRIPSKRKTGRRPPSERSNP